MRLHRLHQVSQQKMHKLDFLLFVIFRIICLASMYMLYFVIVNNHPPPHSSLTMINNKPSFVPLLPVDLSLSFIIICWHYSKKIQITNMADFYLFISAIIFGPTFSAVAVQELNNVVRLYCWFLFFLRFLKC